jgi:PTH1 family peptidyl-tRNA hydrolase
LSSSSLQLLVGLGNPGKDYAETRHNAGAWLISDIAHAAEVTLRHEAKYHGLHGILKTAPQQLCHLLIPTTFMNLSGQAVRACTSYHKILPTSLLVVHDDIDLPVGIARLKFDGGDGGHNGVSDIINHLHTKQFYRLRIGVGHPGKSKDVADYVLTRPSIADRDKIDHVLQQIQTILPLLLAGQFAEAMQKLHSISPD